MIIHRTRDERIAALLALAGGVGVHMSGWQAIHLDGKSYTPTDLEARLTALTEARKKVEEKRADLETALEEEQRQLPEENALCGALVGLVRFSFGNVPNVLVDFGISPRKKTTPLTVDQKAAVVAKGEATRGARHTMGPKQKAWERPYGALLGLGMVELAAVA